jgi:hypothetical protein
MSEVKLPAPSWASSPSRIGNHVKWRGLECVITAETVDPKGRICYSLLTGAPFVPVGEVESIITPEERCRQAVESVGGSPAERIDGGYRSKASAGGSSTGNPTATKLGD